MEQNLIELIGVSSWYMPSNSNDKQPILKNINIEIKSGEIIAIVGKSGSGKSTLLKIIAGLISPQDGEIKFPNNEYNPPSISMVFQNIALFPWLNVIENIDIGLRSQGNLTIENKKKVDEFIKLMGLEGFEDAMPRELSSGMKQRVSLARGFAMNPDILILDEPFTTLDVLTANNLKNDFLKLWLQKVTPLKAVIMVTHSIEEAVGMANRVIVLGSWPSEIIAITEINIAYPRNVKSKEFQEKEEIIFSYMMESNILLNKDLDVLDKESKIPQKLPSADVLNMIALIELLITEEYSSRANIYDLSINMPDVEINELMEIIKGLELLGFIEIMKGDIKLTELGIIFANLSVDQRRNLFIKQLYKFIPLSNYILKIIKNSENHRVHKNIFITYLKNYMADDEAEITLNTIINWGRFGEIFFYNDNDQEFILDNPS